MFRNDYVRFRSIFPSAYWVVFSFLFLHETPLSTWDFHVAPRAEMKQQDHLPHSMRTSLLGFRGPPCLFLTPLFLISSFNRERGSRIAAFEVISTEDFFSFPVPLHTLHKNVGNNRHARRPIIKTLALLLFLCVCVLFWQVYLVGSQWSE